MNKRVLFIEQLTRSGEWNSYLHFRHVTPNFLQVRKAVRIAVGQIWSPYLRMLEPGLAVMHGQIILTIFRGSLQLISQRITLVTYCLNSHCSVKHLIL